MWDTFTLGALRESSVKRRRRERGTPRDPKAYVFVPRNSGAFFTRTESRGPRSASRRRTISSESVRVGRRSAAHRPVGLRLPRAPAKERARGRWITSLVRGLLDVCARQGGDDAFPRARSAREARVLGGAEGRRRRLFEGALGDLDLQQRAAPRLERQNVRVRGLPPVTQRASSVSLCLSVSLERCDARGARCAPRVGVAEGVVGRRPGAACATSRGVTSLPQSSARTQRRFMHGPSGSRTKPLSRAALASARSGETTRASRARFSSKAPLSPMVFFLKDAALAPSASKALSEMTWASSPYSRKRTSYETTGRETAARARASISGGACVTRSASRIVRNPASLDYAGRARRRRPAAWSPPPRCASASSGRETRHAEKERQAWRTESVGNTATTECGALESTHSGSAGGPSPGMRAAPFRISSAAPS